MNNLIILNIRQQRKKLDNIKTSRLLLFVPRKDSGLQCLLLKKPWPNSKHRRSTRSIFVFDVWELLVTSSNRGVSISLGCSRRSGDPPVVYLISADLGGSQTFFALHLPRWKSEGHLAEAYFIGPRRLRPTSVNTCHVARLRSRPHFDQGLKPPPFTTGGGEITPVRASRRHEGPDRTFDKHP